MVTECYSSRPPCKLFDLQTLLLLWSVSVFSSFVAIELQTASFAKFKTLLFPLLVVAINNIFFSVLLSLHFLSDLFHIRWSRICGLMVRGPPQLWTKQIHCHCHRM